MAGGSACPPSRPAGAPVDSPEDLAGPLNRLCFCWVWTHVVGPAYGREATTKEHLPPPSLGDGPALLHAALTAAMRRHKHEGRVLDWVGLFALAVRTQWPLLLSASFFMALYTALVIVQPTLLEALLDNLASPTPSAAVGFPLAVGIFACAAVSSVSVHKFWFDAQRAGMRVTAALSTEVFRRTVVLGPSDRAGYGLGQLTQLMGVDSERLTSGMVLPLLIWGSWPPLVMLAVGLSNLYRLLGWPALVAAALLGSMPFVNAGCLSVRIRNAQSRVQAARDHRIRAATEVLSNVRSLKVLGWEGPSLERVFGLRQKELRAIRTDLLWRVTSALLVVLVPAVATCVSFALYAVVLGKPMSAATVFTATAWIGTLQGPMWQIPSAIRAAATASVSFERLADFFWRTSVVAPLRVLDGGADEEPGVCWDGTDVLWPSTLDGAPEAGGEEAKRGDERGERPPPEGCLGRSGRLSVMSARLLVAAFCCCCPPGRQRTTSPAAVTGPPRGAPVPGSDPDDDLDEPASAEGPAVAVLRGVRLRLGPGLNIVLGATGAGKSSLLASLTGAPIVRGTPPAVRGRSAFVGQRPWLLNATVRENITFVSPFRREWFDRVVDACALRDDMAFFPKGEDTQIGERGISISGGQRARIAIARALYSEAQVVLLDDPLAALDAAVARHVLEQCVLGLMARRGVVVVMGTNLLSLARHPEAVSVALLESGKGGDGASGLRVISRAELASLRLESEAPERLDGASTLESAAAATPGAAVAAAAAGRAAPSAKGTVTAGRAEPGGRASADGKALASTSEPDEPSEHTLLSPERPRPGVLTSSSSSSASQVEAVADRMAYAADVLRSTAVPDSDGAKELGSGTAAPVSGRGQGAEETSQAGFVRLRVFWRYCAACGPTAFAMTYALALVVREVSLLGSDLFLTVWVNSAKGNATLPDPPGGTGGAASAGAFDGGLFLSGICSDAHDAQCFAVVYSLFQSATVLLAALMWLLGVLGSLSASRRLHDSLMTSLLLASQSFFDATPSGLVVNRAVKDMQKVDLSVATNVRTFVFNVLRLLSASILVAAGSPWVLAAMAVLAVPYYALALRFRHAARDLQRLSSASNSPLLSLFGETAGGAHVMRAFGAGAKFLARHRVLAMSYITRSMLLMAVEQWATVWLEVFGSVIVLATAVMLVVARLEGAIPVAIVGFLLTQAQSVPSRLLWVTRNFASLELALVSAERVFEFIDLPDESRAADGLPQERPSSWCTRACGCCSKQVGPAGGGSAAEALLADEGVSEAAAALGMGKAGGRHSLPAWAALSRSGKGTAGTSNGGPRGSGKGARLELASVRLQYEETSEPALRGVCIDLPPGSKVAVVGRSGAGKSSLLAAILQTHAFSGDVRVAGRSLLPEGPWEARRHFAPLSQDAAVFEASVRENVMGFGQEPSDLADDTCREALRVVGLAPRLPDLDERLESSGSLSRGEAQLLGLARCLARAWTLGCGVVLADEATSSVDRGADTRVHDVLFGLPQTVVSICHRLDHISRFDRVVVMHEGVAAEQGPPAELLGDPSSRLFALMEHYRASHERELPA
ncbi:hypothetical protein FNF27_01287 [Cafeteria roenbergensis]|uniref:Uncharacterized protein n=2 Tax=Cafeteria roenbergensis TaxID=33653 RepID=A0A5A8ENJ4_CAFRO|nr:hypothetical protein FNF27_01287 [Cafeteria roenbergensis]